MLTTLLPMARIVRHSPDNRPVSPQLWRVSFCALDQEGFRVWWRTTGTVEQCRTFCKALGRSSTVIM